MFGAFYVWHMGFRKQVSRAFAINLLFAVAFAGFFFGSLTVIRNALQWYGLQVVAIAAFIAIQGVTMLKMAATAIGAAAGWYGRARPAHRPACSGWPTWP